MKNNNDYHLIKIIYRKFGDIETFSKYINIPTKRKWCKDNHINIITMQPNKRFNKAPE